MIWIKDKEFIRGKVPMTKYEVRVLSCVEMGIKKGSKFLDIGAGTGSISIQAAKLGALVSAVESKKEAYNLMLENARKFSVDIEAIEGFAPEVCPDKIYDAIFLGGNRGRMESIFDYVDQHLDPKGILLCNFVTLSNAGKAKNLLLSRGYGVETRLIQLSQEDHLGILRGQNPIFMIKGVKK